MGISKIDATQRLDSFERTAHKMSRNICLTINYSALPLHDDFYHTRAKDNHVKTLSAIKTDKDGQSADVLCNASFRISAWCKIAKTWGVSGAWCGMTVRRLFLFAMWISTARYYSDGRQGVWVNEATQELFESLNERHDDQAKKPYTRSSVCSLVQLWHQQRRFIILRLPRRRKWVWNNWWWWRWRGGIWSRKLHFSEKWSW